MFTKCSNCGNSHVKKVSGIVRSQIKISRTDTNSVKIGRYGYGLGASGAHGSTVRSSVSGLAQILAPPLEPYYPPRPSQSEPIRRYVNSSPPGLMPPHPPSPQTSPPALKEFGQKETTHAWRFVWAGGLFLPFAKLASVFGSQNPQLFVLGLFGCAGYQFYKADIARKSEEAQKARESHATALEKWKQSQAIDMAKWEQACSIINADWQRSRTIKIAKLEQNRAACQKNLDNKYAAEMAQWEQYEHQWRLECEAIKCTWERALMNWDELYYCSRCDHVYDPRTGDFAPASQMHSIL